MNDSWLTEEEARTIVEAATRAASVLNTQPWLFEISGDRIDLFGDVSRQLEVADPDGRQLVMSCGAALLNLRLAMLAAGWDAIVDVSPESQHDMHIAGLGRGRARVPSPEDRSLFEAIPRRRTNRRPFSPEPPKPEALGEITEAAAKEGAFAKALGRVESLEVSDLVLAANSRLRADPTVRAEIDGWTHADTPRDDGIPLAALGPVSQASPSLVRDFGFGGQSDVRGISDFEKNPALVMLLTTGDTRQDWVAAGQALQRMQLTATIRGLATSFLGQPFEASDLRGALETAKVGRGTPQMLLRVGYGPESPATPRRPVAEVLRHPRPRERLVTR